MLLLPSMAFELGLPFLKIEAGDDTCDKLITLTESNSCSLFVPLSVSGNQFMAQFASR